MLDSNNHSGTTSMNTTVIGNLLASETDPRHKSMVQINSTTHLIR